MAPYDCMGLPARGGTPAQKLAIRSVSPLHSSPPPQRLVYTYGEDQFVFDDDGMAMCFFEGCSIERSFKHFVEHIVRHEIAGDRVKEVSAVRCIQQQQWVRVNPQPYDPALHYRQIHFSKSGARRNCEVPQHEIWWGTSAKNLPAHEFLSSNIANCTRCSSERRCQRKGLRSTRPTPYTPPMEYREGYSSSTCWLCHQGEGRLLCCDGCFRAFHLRCIAYVTIPKTPTWYCYQCYDEHHKAEPSTAEAPVPTDHTLALTQSAASAAARLKARQGGDGDDEIPLAALPPSEARELHMTGGRRHPVVQFDSEYFLWMSDDEKKSAFAQIEAEEEELLSGCPSDVEDVPGTRASILAAESMAERIRRKRVVHHTHTPLSDNQKKERRLAENTLIQSHMFWDPVWCCYRPMHADDFQQTLVDRLNTGCVDVIHLANDIADKSVAETCRAVRTQGRPIVESHCSRLLQKTRQDEVIVANIAKRKAAAKHHRMTEQAKAAAILKQAKEEADQRKREEMELKIREEAERKAKEDEERRARFLAEEAERMEQERARLAEEARVREVRARQQAEARQRLAQERAQARVEAEQRQRAQREAMQLTLKRPAPSPTVDETAVKRRTVVKLKPLMPEPEPPKIRFKLKIGR